MKTFVCTCGTSVISKRGINIDRLKNQPLAKSDKFKDEISVIREHILDYLSGISLPQDINDTSAEIKSLTKMGITSSDKVILICTDLIDGKLCGELVKDFLESRQIVTDHPVEIKVFEGLQAANGTDFVRKGIRKLLEYLVKLEYENVIFNVTGGYKSIVPYLALVGMIFNKPVKYIHEDSDDVLILANIPIMLNDELLLNIEDKLRGIDKRTFITNEEWRSGIDYNDRRYDCLVEEIDGLITLSGIGLLFWERFKKDYPEDLEKDETPFSEKKNKLTEQGIHHHGLNKIKLIADKMLLSPYVRSIPNTCDHQPNSRRWIQPLESEEAKKHIQRDSKSMCIVTNIKTEAGYSFLVETTARNYEENKRIAEILNHKYFE